MFVLKSNVTSNILPKKGVWKGYTCLRTRWYDKWTCYPSVVTQPYESSMYYSPTGAEPIETPGFQDVIAYQNSNARPTERPMQRCDHVTKTLLSPSGVIILDKHLDVFVWGTAPYNCSDRYGAERTVRDDAIWVMIGDVLKNAGKFHVGGTVGKTADYWRQSMADLCDLDPYLVDREAEDPYALAIAKLKQLDYFAYDTILPEMEGGFKTPVFLGEIFELKLLWRDAVLLLTKLPSKVWALFSRPLKEISETWLSAIFGWLPFVSDVKSIFNILTTIDDKVFDFIEGQDKVHTSHFQKALSPLTFKPEEWFSDTKYLTIDTSDSEWSFASAAFHKIVLRCKVTREVTEVKYHHTLEYSYKLPGWNRAVQTFLASLDAWGLNISPSDIWELVPFSFVIDWFTDAQSLVETLDYTNLPVQATVYDSCRSIKYRLIETVELEGIEELYLTPTSYDTSDEWTINPGSASYTVVNDAYYRWPGIVEPTNEQQSGFLWPSGLQWITAGALLGSRKG